MTSGEAGKYIVIEGPDGAGKTTQKKLLIDYLAASGRRVIGLHEPGATQVGGILRAILLDKTLTLQPQSEVDLFNVDRRELVHQIIEPEVSKGSIAVSDRSWFSTVAYQGFGRGLDVGEIIEQAKRAMGDYFLPDESLIIDVPVETTLQRLITRSGNAINSDRFEGEPNQFLEKVRRGYIWLAEQYCLEVVDGRPPIDVVHDDIVNHIGRSALS